MKRLLVSMIGALVCLAACATQPKNVSVWLSTGQDPAYPDTLYMTAVGEGPTLEAAQADANRILAERLNVKIRATYKEREVRTGLKTRSSSQSTLSTKVTAQLYGVHILERAVTTSTMNFPKRVPLYHVLVGVRTQAIERYLQGRVDAYRTQIAAVRNDLFHATSPLEETLNLSKIIRLKQRAIPFDREYAVIAGVAPSQDLSPQDETNRLNVLMTTKMVVSLSVYDACHTTDTFSRDVFGMLQARLTNMGFVVAPKIADIIIRGHVSATPISGLSTQYHYYDIRYDFTVSTRSGETWGAESGRGRVAGLTNTQAERLTIQKIGVDGIAPLMQAIQSRLFYDSKSPNYVGFPLSTGIAPPKKASPACVNPTRPTAVGPL